MKKEFRIMYYEETETFAIETRIEGREWCLDAACKCQGENGEFVHYSMLTEIRNLLDFGYKFVYM